MDTTAEAAWASGAAARGAAARGATARGAAARGAAAAEVPAPLWIAGFEAIATRHREALAELCAHPGAQEAAGEVEALLREFRELLSGLALLRDLSARSLDLLMSFGERLSAVIIAAALVERGMKALAVDARDLIIAEGAFGDARPNRNATARAVNARLGPILKASDPCPVYPVVTGFIAANDQGDTLTLGRGGSDYSAAVIAAALGAESLEVWTDVNGIMTADPRKVAAAFSIDALSYKEAMELSHFGAKVIHPSAIQSAFERGIPIRIRNTFDPALPGTLITFDPESSGLPIRGMSSISPVSLVLVQGPGMVGAAGRLFGCLSRQGVNVILISQASSQRSICFAVMPADQAVALSSIQEEFSQELSDGRMEKPLCEGGKAVIAVVGERMRRTPGISGRIFHALGRAGVNVSAIAQGSSELNVSAVIDGADEAKALRGIHDAFFLAGSRSVSVFLVGHGLVGGTLLDQLQGHAEILCRDHLVRIKVVGIADRRKMLIDEAGIDLEGWRARLEANGTGASLGEFAARARALDPANAVFVDCSASDEVPGYYAGLLRSSVAIVTPNKRGNSGSMAVWDELARISRETGRPYLYETTVGAGLPIISTLEDLGVSGDRVLRMDAMLSGTIGYIMSNYDGNTSISRLVGKAHKLGYTEPDPREDLGAMDFARKALILARKAGFPFEHRDIRIEAMISEACTKAASLQDFLARLEEEEGTFLARFKSAKAKRMSLVYAASINREGIELGFREVGPGDPLHGLRDAENVVSFTTDRYATLPLVVRGPGAGAMVTAAGILADIVKVARQGD